VLVLEAPDGIGSWVESRFSGVIAQAAGTVRGLATSVEISSPRQGGTRRRAQAAGDDVSTDDRGPRGNRSGLDPKLTFDQFVISAGARLAHAAALAAAEMPSQAYNPLFIHGAPGTGKTHLLHAIGNLARAHTPGLRVELTTVEEFTASFVESVRDKDTLSFKSRFRDVDILLVDDAQFLAGRSKTAEEFFHTFNAVVDSGAQLVITADRMPAELEAVEDRLKDRFASGLIVDISPPDMAARLAILTMRARRDGLGEIPGDAMDAIAERVRGNVRSLEGALIRVVAYGSLTGASITREIATQVLDQLYPGRTDPQAPMRSQEIKGLVAEAYGVRVADLDSRSRAAHVVWPRQVGMYLSREIAGEPLPRIGEAFGGRNHSTVLNACRRVKDRIADDPETALEIRALERRISGGDDRHA